MRSHKGFLQLAVTIGLSWCFAMSSGAATVFVDDTGVDAPGCGTTAGNACQHIQYAYLLTTTLPNDEIRVMPGTYNECVDASALAFTPPSIKPVRIRADAFVNGGDRTATTITGVGVCDFSSATPLPVVTLGGNGAVLEGFTVTNGGASGVFGIGGVAITNNVITANESSSGGGIYLYTYNCYYGNTTSTISDNDVTLNLATAADGGGVYVLAGGSAPTGGCAAGSSTVTVSSNLIEDNEAADGFGGGLTVLANTSEGAAADVVITQNTIQRNVLEAGSSGYGGGLWASTFGYGSETIQITSNSIAYNEASVDGGGLSAWVNTLEIGDHSILVEGNTVDHNHASSNGGGMDLFMTLADVGSDQSVSLRAENNIVNINIADTSSPNSRFGGAGVLGTYLAVRSAVTDSHFDIVGNTIRENFSQVAGGGLSLYVAVDADADTDGTPAAAPSNGHIETSNNLVVGNVASSLGTAVGGGIYTLLQAFGDASATAAVRFTTVADNMTDDGAGGVEVESYTGIDDLGPGIEGEALLTIDHSIIANNTNFGVGGPRPGTPGVFATAGTGNVHVDVSHSDVFGHPSGSFEPSLMVLAAPPADFPALRETANISVDPLFFAPGDYHLSGGSPLIDAGTVPPPSPLEPTDFEGDPRVLDGNGDGLAVVDLGADEFRDSDLDDVHDQADPCPLDPLNDADSDGLCGSVDNCPTVPNADQANGDGDLLGDACDPCPTDPVNVDVDSDIVCDSVDNCPTVSNADQANGDGDLLGNACDNCPTVTNADQTNSDGDLLGDACDPCPVDPTNDEDSDGHCGSVDNCPTVPNADQANTDGDALGNACDPCPTDPVNVDVDTDGICDSVDNCSTVPNADQANTDGDLFGDACDPCPTDPANVDGDTDGICDSTDNCSTVPNADQANSDGDARGNACDNCPAVTNADQANGDGDLLGDACDPCPTDPVNVDVDTDGICDSADNCSTVPNADQANTDGDARGNACDNCPTVTNADQADADGDSLGDACDNCAADPQNDVDVDGRCGNVDNCPATANADQLDSDRDGDGNACDADDDNDGILDGPDNCELRPNVCDDLDIDNDGRVFGAELAYFGRAFGLCSLDPDSQWWGPINYAKNGLGQLECIDGEDLAVLAAGWACEPGENTCP